jgi:hypothetical protein
MTIQYKNKGFNLNTTDTVSVLTANATSVLIKQIQASNGSGSAALSVVTQVTDTTEAVTYRIGNQSIAAASTTDIITKTLVLESNDILKMTCATKDEIQGIVSYAIINRENQNG